MNWSPAADFAPPELHVRDGQQVIGLLRDLLAMTGTLEHVALLSACIQRLGPFRLSRQIETLSAVLADLTEHAQNKTRDPLPVINRRGAGRIVRW